MTLTEVRNKSIFRSSRVRISAWIFLAIISLIHVFYYFLTEKYLITSGAVLIAVLGVVFYFLFLLVKKIFHFVYSMKNVQLAVITTTCCLIVIELLFISTGFLSTYSEKRDKYFYNSPYTPKNSGWYQIWTWDHDLKTPEYCYHRSINNESLSDIEHPVSKFNNEYRIIGLGDSFTEGDGADVDSTWLKFLERSIGKYKLNSEITFFNAGVCGSDPFFEYILFKNRLLKYSPDLVIVSVNMSDIDDVMVRGGIERFKADSSLKYSPPPWWEPIFAVSHLSRLIFIRLLHYNIPHIDPGSDEFKAAKVKIYESLLMFRELSVKNGFKLLIVFNPVRVEISSNTLFLQDVYDEIKSDSCMETLSLLEYYSTIEGVDSSNCSGLFWKYDSHHNARGYEMYARGVEWKLKQMGLLDLLGYR